MTRLLSTQFNLIPPSQLHAPSSSGRPFSDVCVWVCGCNIVVVCIVCRVELHLAHRLLLLISLQLLLESTFLSHRLLRAAPQRRPPNDNDPLHRLHLLISWLLLSAALRKGGLPGRHLRTPSSSSPSSWTDDVPTKSIRTVDGWAGSERLPGKRSMKFNYIYRWWWWGFRFWGWPSR